MEKFELGDIVQSLIFKHLGSILVTYKKDGNYDGQVIEGILDGRKIHLGSGNLFHKVENVFNKGERK